MASKKNFLVTNPLSKFFSEAFQELKKVVWPKRSEVLQKTVIVVVSMIIIAALAGALDYGLSKGVGFLITLNK